MHPEPVADYANHIGENPMWHSAEDRLYWIAHNLTDTAQLFRYDPETDKDEKLLDTDYIGGFTVQDDGSLLLFMSGGRIAAWDGGNLETVLELELDGEDSDSLFNDVIADPEGRVFCGTRYHDDRTGALHRLDPDGTTTRLRDGVIASNGLGFTPDRTGLYYTDSRAGKIYRYDYDRDTGSISNERIFTTVDVSSQIPDGMTVDEDGYVWSAHAFGGQVVRYAPDGTEDRHIEFPVGLITSLTFGGDDYDDLYVTSGGGQNKAEYGEHAGALFRVDTGVSGVEEFRSLIDV